MKKKLLSIFIVSLLIFIFVVLYEGLEDTNIYTPNINLKNEIPIFKTIDFYTDENLSSSDIFKKNKTYLLNIWSSWCLPCRQEHPMLMSLSEENKINIIGMNYKDNKKKAKNFLKELGNPYKQIFIDLEGTIAIEWGAYGVPESFLIKNNIIIKKYIGPLNPKSIDEIKLIIK